MKIKISPFLKALCFGIFLILTASQVSAQANSLQNSKNGITQESSGFSKVIDSKIDQSDLEVIRILIESSEHSAFLKTTLSSTIYILDLDHFRNGMPDFSVYGKNVKILQKNELIDLAVPFYLTIDGYNKKENSCTAAITLHSNSGSNEGSKSRSVILEKTANSWTKSN